MFPIEFQTVPGNYQFNGNCNKTGIRINVESFFFCRKQPILPYFNPPDTYTMLKKITPEKQQEILLSFDVQHENYLEKYRQVASAYTTCIDQYGIGGFLLAIPHRLMQYAGHTNCTVFHYQDAPAENPWAFTKGLTVKKAIDEIWKSYPVPFVKTLKKYCIQLFVLRQQEKWFLLYPYKKVSWDNQLLYDFFAGAAPDATAQLPKETIEAGWTMPTDLRQLYSIHHGFGDVDSVLRNDNSFAIVASPKLLPQLSFLEEIAAEKEWDVNFSFHDLLPFLGDSAGNYQVFYKAEPTGTGSYYTVDWDHETKEISGRDTLAEFMEADFGESLRKIDALGPK